jgi:tripeptide aminopeptidase
MLPDLVPDPMPDYDQQIRQLATTSQVATVIKHFHQYAAQAVDLAVKIQQIPAPTFAEAKRATFVQAQFEAMGLQDVTRDDLDNVYGRFPAHSQPVQPPLIISAHTDTVFAAHTDLTLRHDGRLLYGPGLADNSMGVAGILFLAQTLIQFDFQHRADVWFVANVGEEGLGDLCGMRAVCRRFGTEARYIVVEGGLFGQISCRSIGVRRFRIEVETAGGHSWGSFGKPSAIHELGHLIAAIDSLDVPQTPKTTYNVGVIEGGRSINTIAATASLLLDLRSEDPDALDQLVEQVTTLVQERVVPSSHDRPYVEIKMEQIGSRPAGQVSPEVPLVAWTEAALRQVGWEKPLFIASSTDANIPLSLGAEAVCLGLAESGNAHRLDEYLDPTWLPQGLSQLLLVTLAAAS